MRQAFKPFANFKRAKVDWHVSERNRGGKKDGRKSMGRDALLVHRDTYIFQKYRSIPHLTLRHWRWVFYNIFVSHIIPQSNFRLCGSFYIPHLCFSCFWYTTIMLISWVSLVRSVAQSVRFSLSDPSTVGPSPIGGVNNVMFNHTAYSDSGGDRYLPHLFSQRIYSWIH